MDQSSRVQSIIGGWPGVKSSGMIDRNLVTQFAQSESRGRHRERETETEKLKLKKKKNSRGFKTCPQVGFHQRPTL